MFSYKSKYIHSKQKKLAYMLIISIVHESILCSLYSVIEKLTCLYVMEEYGKDGCYALVF